MQAALFSRLIWARDQGQRPVSSARYSSTVASETSTDSLATQRGFTAFELLHDEVRLPQPPASRSATTVPGMAGRVHPPRTWYQPSAFSSCLDVPGRPGPRGSSPPKRAAFSASIGAAARSCSAARLTGRPGLPRHLRDQPARERLGCTLSGCRTWSSQPCTASATSPITRPPVPAPARAPRPAPALPRGPQRTGPAARRGPAPRTPGPG